MYKPYFDFLQLDIDLFVLMYYNIEAHLYITILNMDRKAVYNIYGWHKNH